MRVMLLIVLSAMAVPTLAAPLPETPGLLPTPVVRPLLEQDPSVAAARASLEAARQEAGILDSSPYEWNARLSSQRRSVQSGPNYQEWNAGIERTFRLPGKAAADRNIGKAAVEEAEARYGDAKHEAARELLSLWVDWLQAEQGYELAERNGKSAQENLDAVVMRARAGDAAKLDVSLAQAELADQKRVANDARTQTTVSWARLQARFPTLGRQFTVLPEPLPLQENAAFWRERILAQSDELKTVRAQLQRAQAQTERARADKVPDPTVGVYNASELGGQERITGIMISMPIPGGQRKLRITRAVYSAEVIRQEVALRKRQLEAEIASNVATANGAYESLQIAGTGAFAMQSNARLMQRAYSLGEADLQSLLAARRQATAATQSALAARSSALKSYYLLLIDAHLIWDLEHD